MLTHMKKIYLTPDIRIQSIETEDILDASIPLYDDADHKDVLIESGDEVLGNSISVWEAE